MLTGFTSLFDFVNGKELKEEIKTDFGEEFLREIEKRQIKLESKVSFTLPEIRWKKKDIITETKTEGIKKNYDIFLSEKITGYYFKDCEMYSSQLDYTKNYANNTTIEIKIGQNNLRFFFLHEKQEE